MQIKDQDIERQIEKTDVNLRAIAIEMQRCKPAYFQFEKCKEEFFRLQGVMRALQALRMDAEERKKPLVKQEGEEK